MPLLVSGKDEKGKVVDVPRDPASFAYVLERRMEAPKDVREAWQNNYFFTGDGSTAGTEGDHLIVLDAQPLHELTAESELYQGALVLPAGAWNELKGQKEKVFHLTAEEVQEANDKGYVKKDGVWTPANKTVARVWDTFSRGQDLTLYVQLVSESSPYSDSLLNVYFNPTTKEGKSTMRSWVAGIIDYDSDASGSNFLLDGDYGRLVGVAPEAHVAREKALEARVQSALETGKAFEFNGRVYAPVSGVSLK
ncbi:MAG: hypothetical protein Q8R53_01030 [Nanoarchaeota archaeon]|nr:hypothetical protein [Nanoarchaeota archaeon]